MQCIILAELSKKKEDFWRQGKIGYCYLGFYIKERDFCSYIYIHAFHSDI